MASPALLSSTIHLGAQTLSDSVPGTIDLSDTETLIQLESTMFASKLIVTSLLCVTAVVGILGINEAPPAGDSGGDAVIGNSIPLDTIVLDQQSSASADNAAEVAGQAAAVANGQEVADGNLLVVYKFQFVDAQVFADTLKVLMPDTEHKVDAGLNQLVARATSSQHRDIAELLQKYDVPGAGRRQVASDSAANGVAEYGGAVVANKFKLYASDAKPVEKWMHDMLQQPVPLLDFPGETSLAEVLRLVAEYCGRQNAEVADEQFRFTVYSDKSELGLEGSESLGDVIVSDINFTGMTLENALDLIFLQTTAPELAYEM